MSFHEELPNIYVYANIYFNNTVNWCIVKLLWIFQLTWFKTIWHEKQTDRQMIKVIKTCVCDYIPFNYGLKQLENKWRRVIKRNIIHTYRHVAIFSDFINWLS